VPASGLLPRPALPTANIVGLPPPLPATITGPPSPALGGIDTPPSSSIGGGNEPPQNRGGATGMVGAGNITLGNTPSAINAANSGSSVFTTGVTS
jgi:hypothetical protein